MSRETGIGPVQIHIDGLMIGRFSDDEQVCEIGVLPAEGHKFTVSYDVIRPEAVIHSVVDTSETNPSNELRRYSFEIEGAAPDAAPFFSETKPDRHNPSTEENSPERDDFRWVLEVEGDEFPKHGGHLLQKANLLKPVIQIKNGLFYNKKLSKPLIRKANGREEDFGVASDEMAVDLAPEPGQFVVMKNIDTGRNVFRIPIESEQKVDIFINNVPEVETTGNVFHFHMYYELFDQVPAPYRYDFIVKQDPADSNNPGGGHDHDHTHGDTQPAPQPNAGGRRHRGGGSAPLCGMIFVGNPGE